MSELFGPGMRGGAQPPRKYVLPRKYVPPINSSKSEVKKIDAKKDSVKKPETISPWGSYQKMPTKEILKKFKDDKLFGQTGISRADREKYAKEIFGSGTGYGSRENLKKEIKKLKGEASSGRTEAEQSQARKRLNLLGKVFGKDVR